MPPKRQVFPRIQQLFDQQGNLIFENLPRDLADFISSLDDREREQFQFQMELLIPRTIKLATVQIYDDIEDLDPMVRSYEIISRYIEWLRVRQTTKRQSQRLADKRRDETVMERATKLKREKDLQLQQRPISRREQQRLKEERGERERIRGREERTQEILPQINLPIQERQQENLLTRAFKFVSRALFTSVKQVKAMYYPSALDNSAAYIANPIGPYAPTFTISDTDLCSVILSFTNNNGNFVQVNAQPIIDQFRILIQEFRDEIHQEIHSDIHIENELIRPFYMRIRTLIKPLVDQKFDSLHRKNPSTIHREYLKHITRNADGLFPEQKFQPKSTFLQVIIETYQQNNPELMTEEEYFEGFTSDNIINLLAQLLAVEDPLVNRIYNALNTNTNRAISEEIWTFLYQWITIYYENADVVRYMTANGYYHISNIIAQNYFGDQFTRRQRPVNIEMVPRPGWWTMLEDIDISRYLWTYLVLNFIIRAAQFDPLDSRLVRILFHPHDVRIVQMSGVDLTIPDTEVTNFIPYVDTPFIIPHTILSSQFDDNQHRALQQQYAPGLILSKILQQPNGVNTQVNTYALRFRDLVTQSFQLSTFENVDDRIIGQLGTEMDGMYTAARIMSAALFTYNNQIINAFNYERSAENQQILRVLRETIFADQPRVRDIDMLDWLKEHDVDYPEIQPMVRVILNFTISSTQNIDHEIHRQLRDIALNITIGPNQYRQIRHIMILEPDDPTRIEFFLQLIHEKLNDYVDGVNDNVLKQNSWESIYAEFEFAGEIMNYTLSGVSLQINHYDVRGGRTYNNQQRNRQKQLSYFNALSASRYEVIGGREHGIGVEMISRGVFNEDILPHYLKQQVNNRVYIYKRIINLGYSCLAAMIASIFEAVGYIYSPNDFDGIEYIDLMDYITMYGASYVDEYVLPLFSLLQGTEPDIDLIIGDKDILYHYMVTVNKFIEVPIKRFVGLPTSILQPHHYQQFRIPCWNRDNQTFKEIAFSTFDLKQTYDPLADPNELRGYYVITVPLFMKHIFFVQRWCEYINHITDWSKRKDRRLIDLNKEPFPQNPGVQFPRAETKTKEILIFYDLETTCGPQVIMTPYLVTYSIVRPPFDKTTDPIRVDYLEGEQCIQQFIEMISNLSRTVEENTIIYLHAFNGSRFDHIFLLPILYQHYSDIYLTGSPTNVKCCSVQLMGGRRLQLVDTQLATGSQSLDSFVKSMGIREAKLDCPEILLIQSLDYWNSCSPEIRNKIIEYGRRDTEILARAFLIFNLSMLETSTALFKKLRPNSKIGDLKQYKQSLFVKPTLASTAYQIVHKIVRQSKLVLINSKETYQAVRQSYFGGITQVFSKELISIDEQLTEQIEYIDINSLYPSVMAQQLYTGEIGNVQKLNATVYHATKGRGSHCLYGVSRFYLLRQIFRYGFIPVRTFKSGRIFYPVSWDRQKEAEMENMQYNDSIEQLIWIWGFQLQKIFEIEHMYQMYGSMFEIRAVCRNRDEPEYMFADIKHIYQQRLRETDPSKKQMYKLIMNSSYGKYGQRDFPVEHFVPLKQLRAHVKNGSLQEYMEYIENTQYHGGNLLVRDIQEFEQCGIARVGCIVARRQPELPINNKPKSVHIASQITAHARNNIMYRLYVAKYHAPGIRLMYMDTDSIIFAGTTPQVAQALTAFGLGDNLGDFKREYTNIIEFQALAPKMYKIKLATSEVISKLKGASQKYLDQEQMNRIFEQITIGQKPSYTQIQWKRHSGTCRITQTPITKKISIFDKRWYGRFENYNSDHDLPYSDQSEALSSEKMFNENRVNIYNEEIQRYRREQLQREYKRQLDLEIERLRRSEFELD